MARRPRRRSHPAADVSSNEWIAALALGMASFAWNLSGGAFPPTFHPDETRLIGILAGGVNDWSDPALFPHLVGATASLVGAETPLAITATGRVLAALFGAISVLLVWRLARDVLQPKYAWFGAALVAVCPLFTTHTHHAAPDTLAFTLGLGSILCLTRLLEDQPRGWTALLGGLVGLALSAHYGSLLLALLCAAAAGLVPARARRGYARTIRRAAGIAALVFLVTNPSLFLAPGQILTGPWVQLQRLFGGDHLYVTGPATWFTFHLVGGLWPGLTAPVVLTTAAGLGVAVARRDRLPRSAWVIFLYGALAYGAAELSPLKPQPGSLRYLLPTLPAAALASGLALQALEDGLAPRSRSLRVLPVALLVLVLLVPGWRSVRLVDELGDDTRSRADAWIATHARRALRGLHSSALRPDFTSLAGVDLDAARRSGVTHLATSSFVYDTFARGSRLANQRTYVYDRHERYQELFEYPYEEFAPLEPTFGWSNPTVRVLDIREAQPPGRP